ncbi:hypothetical protein J3E73DRAFT_413121 [Bipolaris maydis]|nr:hypothetical protein J3E73DRAFT_413121 [Bipolaris maydis]
MLSFLKRIQRWHEEHKPIENPEKQGNQKVQAPLAALHHEERELIEVEKRNNQQAQALLAALHKLQCNMDPFIAAQTYNSRFCPLTSRLPDELLLCVLDFLSDDVVTLSCLRIVSRKFFHMVGSKPVYGENLKPIIYQSESLPKSGPGFTASSTATPATVFIAFMNFPLTINNLQAIIQNDGV